MMTDAHSILPPSSAGIWGKTGGCTGWVEMMKSVPISDEPDVDAEEGSASHEVGEQLINKGTASGRREVLKVGEAASNGVIVNEEMIEGAEVYAEDFLSVFRPLSNVTDLRGGAETRVPIIRVHQSCFGTVDSWLYDPTSNTLYVWDYKFGHVFVEVFENLQGICYAGGLQREHGIPENANVVFRIVQPRTYTSEGPVREWKTTMGALDPYFTTLSTNAAKALSDRAELKTGSHCQYCDACLICDPAIKAGAGLYELAGAPLPMNASPETIGRQLAFVERAMAQLKGLQTAYTAQVTALIKSGKNVPGWGVQPAFGREAWTAPVESIVTLGDLLGVDVRKPGVLTPNQARKLGMDEATVASLTERKQNGMKLVKETSVKLRKIFT